MKASASLLDHAKLYVTLGLKLIPLHRPILVDGSFRCSCGRKRCDSPGKHPDARRARNGSRDATGNLLVIASWFSTEERNLGIVTGAQSQIVALDVDPRHEGDETLRQLEIQFGSLPPTWRFLTGGGGEHIVFRYPSARVSNSAGKIGLGIDVRGDGGYIVAPPSLHISGRRYAVSVDHHPEDVMLADMPDWLLAAAGSGISRPKSENSRPIARRPRSIDELRSLSSKGLQEGLRNDGLTRITGHLVSKHVDPHIVLDLLLALNATKCSPPLPDDEVIGVVASIVGRHARTLRHAG